MNVIDLCNKASKASKSFAGADTNTKNAMLDTIANAIIDNAKTIKQINNTDIINAEKNGKDSTFIDRLRLTDSRIQGMADGVRAIIKLNDPVLEVVEEREMYNGIKLTKVRAPLGVIAIIYEARPNVTVDCTALTIKSGNAVILRGSKDSINSNRELYRVMKEALTSKGYDSSVIQFVDDESRETTLELLQQGKTIDVVIPRGGDTLKNWVLSNATMPVIASAGGNCHIFVDASADIDMATEIVYNAKVQRPSVCNACEQLIVSADIAEEFLPVVCAKLLGANVEMVGCERAQLICSMIGNANDEDYYTEHLAYKISIKIIDGIEQAIEWINEHNTKHSEAIITKNKDNADLFCKCVDAAAIYVNASTRFTDGFEFGMGAEMGISTQKLHARGPLGLKELTSVKYVLYGEGQVRK